MIELTCRFCGQIRISKMSRASHEKVCNLNPNKHVVSRKGRVAPNKGKRASEETKRKMSASLSGKPWNGKHTEESKEKLRQVAIKRGFGGITQSRWIKYKDKTLGSSYELKVAESLDENGIIWDTCKRINYIDPTGKVRSYTPDFYLKDFDVYLDPKNDFLIEKINPSLGFSDIEKIKLVSEQNHINVIILNKNELSWNEIFNILLKSDSGDSTDLVSRYSTSWVRVPPLAPRLRTGFDS